MNGIYQTWIVVLSIVVAIASSHAALSLAQRMSRTRGMQARMWLAGGAVSMGIGIWAMHFIGMMAFQLPIPLAYDVPTTLLSLAIAIAASAYALSIAAEPEASTAKLLRNAVVMGIGICSMHYVGMLAITVTPRLSYDPLLFAASMAIAMISSFVALKLFFHLRGLRGFARHLTRGLAAVVMGLAIAGLHYTGMAATRFGANSWCGGGLEFSQQWLALLIAVIALGLLGVTALLLLVDSHLAARARRHSMELQEVNQQLRHAATHDSLTALPNRTLMLDRLTQAVHLGQRQNTSFAVVAFDLDRFKVVNDTLGHAAGDELLRHVSQRVGAVLRRSDTLARMGGDEFVALLPGVGTRTEASRVLAKVQESLQKSMDLNGVAVHVASSIGVAFFPQDSTDPVTLLRHADAAMYFAKRQGRNNLQFFGEGMETVDLERLELENDLRGAIAAKQLVVYYQAKVDVGTGRIMGTEALVRWQHPKRGLIPPTAFIPIAEETGLILSIGEWVLNEACRQLRTWHDAGFTHLTMAVNLSAEQFSQPDLPERVREALQRANVPARCLELELTESAVMRDSQRSVRTLGEIAALGVRISVDDFGTGYSSLSYLRRLPLHTLKIDRSFIHDVESSREDAEIVRAIVSLAHSLELDVTAEGVENTGQHEFVRRLGCETFQGYLCSKPVPPEQFLEALKATTETTASRPQRLVMQPMM
ncbi:MAG: bifunctional diguanylate cyclase/phosphodiesterase [Pseudomonadota bacterium]